MPASDQLSKQTRRSFLFLPISVFSGVLTALGIAAFRFLRPRIVQASTADWIDVASLTELKGDLPLALKIITDQVTGWALTRQEHHIYALPGKSNQVLSAVCPHEGCEV